MNEEQNLKELVKQIKGVDDGINSMIIPMLKDTINDYKKTFNKMIIIVILLIASLLGTVCYSQFLIYKQNKEYKEFLSQFEFESEVYQDLNTDQGRRYCKSNIK